MRAQQHSSRQLSDILSETNPAAGLALTLDASAARPDDARRLARRTRRRRRRWPRPQGGRWWFPTRAVTLLSLAFGLLLAIPSAAQALTETQKLTATDAAALDGFGGSLAVSGDTAIIGAAFDDDRGPESGSAYVFVHGAGGWTEQAKLFASDAAADDWFGFSVAISGDTAIVGAPRHSGVEPATGSAYVFVRSGIGWTQQAKLVASDAAALDGLGGSVAIDGDTAVVGANDDLVFGSAYVFVRSGGSWTEQAKLVASDSAALDSFGDSVAVSGDTALVGAAFTGDARSAGSAYIFVRSGGGWTEQAKLVASAAAAGDEFGGSVALSGDTALVGAALSDDAGNDSGSSYVFVRSAGAWAQQQKLTATDAAVGDFFGASLAIDGETVLVGVPFDDEAAENSGSAYVFRRSGGRWAQQAKLTAGDAAAGDQFGSSVAISGDTALVGAAGDDDAGDFSGSAYVFDLADSDGDGLSDTVEGRLGTSPISADSDGDGIGDFLETDGGSPIDTDADGTIDALDPDSDGDGIADSVEGAADTDGDGTANYRDTDSDADGLPDGSDPDTVAAVVTGLPESVFAPGGHRTAILSILEEAEQKIAAGDAAAAIRSLSNLRGHVDGCETGPAADRNDWIVPCPEQDLVRGLIDVLIRELSS